MSIKHLYEDERPTLLFDFANSKTLDPRITFERQSVGTYVDEAGIIKSAADNEPRFDHDPVTGECLGLLIEEERTNNITNSTDFSNANGDWGAGGFGGTASAVPTLTPASGTAPDGTNTATRMQAATGGGTTSDDFSQITCQRTTSANAAVSVWMKSNTGANQNVWMSGGGGTEVVTPQWQRFTGTSTQWRIGVRGDFSDANIDILIWGAQVEKGLNPGGFTTSYIPTSGSTYQRKADECVFNDSNVFGSSSGTFIVDSTIFAGLGDNLQNIYIFLAIAGTDAVSITAGAGYSVQVLDSSIGPGFNYTGLVNYPAYTSGVRVTTAVAYATGPSGSSSADVVYASDGAMRGTNTATAGSTTPTGMDQMYLFRTNTNAGTHYSLATGYLHKLAYYNTRLPNSALEELTK